MGVGAHGERENNAEMSKIYKVLTRMPFLWALSPVPCASCILQPPLPSPRLALTLTLHVPLLQAVPHHQDMIHVMQHPRRHIAPRGGAHQIPTRVASIFSASTSPCQRWSRIDGRDCSEHIVTRRRSQANTRTPRQVLQ